MALTTAGRRWKIDQFSRIPPWEVMFDSGNIGQESTRVLLGLSELRGTVRYFKNLESRYRLKLLPETNDEVVPTCFLRATAETLDGEGRSLITQCNSFQEVLHQESNGAARTVTSPTQGVCLKGGTTFQVLNVQKTDLNPTTKVVAYQFGQIQNHIFDAVCVVKNKQQLTKRKMSEVFDFNNWQFLSVK